MSRLGAAWRYPLIIGALLIVSMGVARAQTPTNLRADNVVTNHHVLGHTPTLCWDFTGNQTNWQIQADDDPNYTPDPGAAVPNQLWYWDSGTQDKGIHNTDRCAVFRQILATGFVAITLDRRAHSSYWRLRLQVNGTTWGPWVSTEMRMNQYPLLAENMTVLPDPLGSTDPVDPVPAKTTPKTYYVSTTGNDLNAGTLASPFRTLTRATKALLKGDTLLVRGGIYNENVLISSNSGHVSGQPNNPITVKAYPGETPIVRALSTGSRTAITLQGPSLKLSDWVLDGLTVGGSSTLIGIVVDGMKSATVKNCRLEATLLTWPTAGVDAMQVVGGSEDVRITGCIFDKTVQNQLHVSNARHVEIRNNNFTASGRMGVLADGGTCPNMVIADNRFHDASPDQAMIALYIGTQGTRVVNNLFSNILLGTNKLAWGILELRSGEIYVDGNTFYNVQGVGVMLREWTSFSLHRNNIFVKCGNAILFTGGILPGSATQGAVVDYNLFYQNTLDMRLPSGELPLFDHAPVGNCMGGPPPSNSACDPRFVNATAQDFRLQAGSPAIDAGDPLSPVPVGGGSRVDAGRYEYGAATPPYDYQSRLTLADSTPRFTWETVDIDPRLGDPDGQSKFQIQIDPRPTFDSLSEGRPALDSGIVTSALESYTIPNARALAPGEYYVRVRQWDRYDFEGGAWSDHAYRVRVSGEPQPPYIASQNPAPGAQGVNENTSISAHVKDDGVGVNVATLRMYVNGALVTPVVGGSLNDYTLTYTPPSPFTTGTTVTVRITADDFNLSPPGLDVAYPFTIRDTTPPLPPANVRVIP